jgi:hypothetical protein
MGNLPAKSLQFGEHPIAAIGLHMGDERLEAFLMMHDWPPVEIMYAYNYQIIFHDASLNREKSTPPLRATCSPPAG